jgi:hypothetical protein
MRKESQPSNLFLYDVWARAAQLLISEPRARPADVVQWQNISFPS